MVHSSIVGQRRECVTACLLHESERDQLANEMILRAPPYIVRVHDPRAHCAPRRCHAVTTPPIRTPHVTMRSGALLGLIACQLVLAEPVRELRRFGENPHSLSNIELLVPLMMSDASEESDESDTSAASERYERARVDKDTPFSNIPSSAFVLDESPPAASHKHKRGHKHSRKQDLAYRPRSIYLESLESTESDEQDERSEQVELGVEIARACSRLMRSPPGHQNELLLLLCSELQDAAPAPPAPVPDCACCQQGAAPLWLESLVRARRGLVPFGENSYKVQSYMRSPRKRSHHMPTWDQ